MMQAIFIIDSSGVPIHTWKNRDAPKDLFKMKEESLISGFVSALINFGQETFAAPQRIDFNGYALTFYTVKYKEGLYWIAAISDSIDPRNATGITLKKLADELRPLISELLKDSGFVYDEKGFGKKINQKINEILKKQIRFLPNLRSKTLDSALLSTIFGTISAYFLLQLNQYINEIIGINDVFISFGIFAIMIGISGIISGFIAGTPLGGFLGGYLSLFLGLILFNIEQPLEKLLGNLLVAGITYNLLAGFTGFLMGFFYHNRKLLLLKRRKAEEELLPEEPIEEGKEKISKEELDSLSDLENMLDKG